MGHRTHLFGPIVLMMTSLVVMPVFGQSPAVGITAVGAANDWVVPRTPWDHPDLQGIWTTDEEVAVPVERSQDLGERLELSLEEIAARTAQREAGLTQGSGQTGDGPPHWYEAADNASTRTSFIVDPPNGRIPSRTGDGERRWNNRNRGSGGGGPFNGPEDLDLRDRCITRGLPNTYFPSAYNNGFQIVQSEDHVAIVYERLHEHRLIPLDDRPHLNAEVRQWFGDSRARWEDDTLVVETRNFGEDVNFRGSTNGLHLVERFTRVNEETVSVKFTVSDPSTFTSDWTVVVNAKNDPSYWQIFEYACHEANYGMFNILSGARAEDAKAAASGSR